MWDCHSDAEMRLLARITHSSTTSSPLAELLTPMLAKNAVCTSGVTASGSLILSSRCTSSSPARASPPGAKPSRPMDRRCALGALSGPRSVPPSKGEPIGRRCAAMPPSPLLETMPPSPLLLRGWGPRAPRAASPSAAMARTTLRKTFSTSSSSPASADPAARRREGERRRRRRGAALLDLGRRLRLRSSRSQRTSSASFLTVSARSSPSLASASIATEAGLGLRTRFNSPKKPSFGGGYDCAGPGASAADTIACKIGPAAEDAALTREWMTAGVAGCACAAGWRGSATCVGGPAKAKGEQGRPLEARGCAETSSGR